MENNLIMEKKKLNITHLNIHTEGTGQLPRAFPQIYGPGTSIIESNTKSTQAILFILILSCHTDQDRPIINSKM